MSTWLYKGTWTEATLISIVDLGDDDVLFVYGDHVERNVCKVISMLHQLPESWERVS